MADVDIGKLEPLELSLEAPDVGTTPPPTPPPPKGQRRALKNVRRELSEEELASPAVQRMLIDDLERLSEENSMLKEYQDKYHEVDKKVAVLDEKLKENVGQEILFGVCLTMGAAIIGLAPTIWETGGGFAVAVGFIFIIGGIASKVAWR